jgi:hypothetical protein
MLVDVSVASRQFIPTSNREILFLTVSIGILVTEYMLLELIKPLLTATVRRKSSELIRIYTATKAVQYALGAMVIFVILQIFLESYYSTVVLLTVIVCSYALSIGVLAVFIRRILTWLSFRRNATIFVLFLVVSGSITANALITMISVSLGLEHRPGETRLLLGGSLDVGKGRYYVIDDLYLISYVILFISVWAASAVLLSYHARKLGRMKYWIITAIPLIFFLMQFPLLFAKVLFPEVSINQFMVVALATSIASLGKPIGGLMLAVGFWTMGRTIKKDIPVRHYLVVAGFGVLLLFTSNQAILMSVLPYPPFGLSTITVMGFSAYLLVFGIVTSSVSASLDSDLRNSIKQLARSKLKLIDSIMTAQMAKEIEDKVKEVAKLQLVEMENKGGVPPSLDEKAAQEYLKEVIKEIHKEHA